MKIFIATMKLGADTCNVLVFATDSINAKEVAELRYDNWRCISVRRVTS